MELALPGEWLAGSSYFCWHPRSLDLRFPRRGAEGKKKKPDTSQSTDSSKMLVL